jgi:hypothetical protein
MRQSLQTFAFIGFLLILFLEAIVHKFFGDHEHFDQRAVSPPTASSSEVKRKKNYNYFKLNTSFFCHSQQK